MDLMRMLLWLGLCAVVACGQDASGGGQTPGQDVGDDAGLDVFDEGDLELTDVAGDAQADREVLEDTNPSPDQGRDVAAPVPRSESEPNDGASDNETNPIAVDDVIAGTIGQDNDVDIFRINTVPGKIYTATLTTDPSSTLSPLLTVIDDGRGHGAAGEDYVKLSVGPDPRAPSLDFLAMGFGGYYVAVRDAFAQGDADHTYRLDVVERGLGEFSGQPLGVSTSLGDTLSHAASLRLYPMNATEGSDLVVDLQAADSGMDPRLFIVLATGDWIARNDDRAVADHNPLIDAPLTGGGDMFVVVENISFEATDLSYSMSVEVE